MFFIFSELIKALNSTTTNSTTTYYIVFFDTIININLLEILLKYSVFDVQLNNKNFVYASVMLLVG